MNWPVSLGPVLLFFLCFCGMVAVVALVEYRKKLRLRAMEQQERFALIERGLADEEAVARERAESDRVRAVGAIGVTTVIGVMAAAVLVTWVAAATIGERPADRWMLIPIFAIVWPVAVVLSGVVGLVCLADLRRRRPDSPAPAAGAPAPRNAGATGIQENLPREGGGYR